jgi:hypothetical protein
LVVQGVICAAPPPRGTTEWTDLAKCIHATIATGIVNSSITILTDLVILLLPVPVIMGLKLQLRIKIGIAAIFLSGIL